MIDRKSCFIHSFFYFFASPPAPALKLVEQTTILFYYSCIITVKDTILEKILYVRHNSTSELTLSKQLVPIDGGGRGLSRDVRR